MIEFQGGDVSVIDDPEKLAQAPIRETFSVKKRGYLTAFDTRALGTLISDLGGGRRQASDTVDPAVGLLFFKKLGQKVAPSEPLIEIHARTPESAKRAHEQLMHAVTVSGSRKSVPKLITETV